MGTTSGGDRPWQSYNTVYTNAKAGMDGVDKEKVQRIVYEMSKGSKYFENEKRKEEFIQQRIENLREQYTKLTKEDTSHFQEIANRKMIELEASRDLSKIWLHSDMDAFYAAVETIGNPSMKGKPLAVGSMSMLCTASYEARKFGVRAAMPGFIARKLCPELIFVPPNFDKYTYYSELTRKVFRRYDPNFIANSLDEAYLNITDICNERGISSEEVAVELRNAIYEETGLTCSCGVAPNRLLAKVCSDINKPNGQFILPNDRKAVMIFIASLPIRKIGGIGKVTEHVLRDVLAVNTCEEMLQNSAYLCALFSPCSADFFLSVGLGLGRTDTPQYNQRKSISCERTFSAIEDESLLFQKLADISNTLSNDMQKECLCGRTLTLKLKTSSFDVRTRAVSLQKHICSKEDILYYASKLLKAELPLSLRLMGLRMSHFHDDKQGPSDPMQKTLKDFVNWGVASSSVSNVSESTELDIDVNHLMKNGDTDLSIGEGSCYSNGDSGFSLSNEFEDLLESDQLPPVCKYRADNDAGGTKNMDDVFPVKSEPSRPMAVNENETDNHKVESIWVDCICSVCGLELPPSFTEEMQEHADYHLAERIQAEESMHVTRPLEDLHERSTKKPLNSREISRKKQKHSPKEERHIPIDAFFVKRDKNPTNSSYFSGE